jgi:glycosyltransferase involved in cell wall biosynthesis
MKKRPINNLLIVSHVTHYQWADAFYAYGPYVREIDIWADLFPTVRVAAPLRMEEPPADCLPFSRANIHIIPQPERGGDRWQDKLFQFASLPWMLLQLFSAMRQADAIQVRCPGNLGLLGVLFAPLFSRYRVAKYAGQWNGYKGEAWSYRLQRWLLQSKWWNAPVLVYGNWRGQPAHIIPFFTSILEREHLILARQCAPKKQMHHPLRVLFVGRLTREKNVHILLQAIQSLQVDGLEISCRIIGTGPMQEQLGAQVIAMNRLLSDVLMGAMPFESVLEQYIWADVLVLASETEGWPKAIAEAMAFGVVCVGSNRGLVPQMLESGRGLLVEPGDAKVLADILRRVVANPDNFVSMSLEAAAWSQQYTLEGFKNAIPTVLISAWGLQADDLIN